MLWSTETSEMVMINKYPEALTWEHCFSGIINAGQLGLRNCLWLGRDQHHWGEIFWKVFLRSQDTKDVVHIVPGLYPVTAVKICNVDVSQVVLVLKVWKVRESSRVGLAGHGEQTSKKPCSTVSAPILLPSSSPEFLPLPPFNDAKG